MKQLTIEYSWGSHLVRGGRTRTMTAETLKKVKKVQDVEEISIYLFDIVSDARTFINHLALPSGVSWSVLRTSLITEEPEALNHMGYSIKIYVKDFKGDREEFFEELENQVRLKGLV